MLAATLDTGGTARKKSVLLVEDHPIVREGIIQRIACEADLVVCAEARTPAEALLLLKQVQPDVIVVDLAFPEGDGLDLIKEIRALGHRMPILVFSMVENPIYAVRALKAGAQGYLTKREASDKLVNGIRAVLSGQSAVSSDVAEIFLHGAVGNASVASDPSSCLGNRELEVFELLGRGIGTRQIAEQLGRSIKTIETYRARIKRKLHLKDSPALMREAVRWLESHPR